MRRIVKAYVAVSCVFFGTILVGCVALAAASWLAPGFVSAAWTRASREASALTGVPAEAKSVASAVAPAPQPSPTQALPFPTGSLSVAGDAPAQGRDASQQDGWIDIGALEARLRLLDRTVPAWSLDSAAAGVAGSVRDARLAAWESLKKPLVGFLNTTGGLTSDAASGARVVPEDATIESIARDAALRLDALRDEYSAAASKVLRNLEPGAIARLLADEKSVPEDRARLILARLPLGAATEVMEKLSRLAPGRAARLLERLTGAKDKADG